MAIVYGITTKTDPRIRYIGWTGVGVAERLRQHLKKAPRTPFYRWLRSNRDVIEVVVLEETDDGPKREFYWLTLARAAGADLFNVHHGGQPSPSRRGGSVSADHRRRIAEANRGKVASAEARERMSRARMGRPGNSGQHARWHRDRGVVSDSCAYCVQERGE